MRLKVSFLLFALVTVLLIPISAGAQISATCAAAYDSNGIRVGSTDRLGLDGSSAIVFLEDQGNLVTLTVYQDLLWGPSTVYFNGSNCNPPAYMSRTNSLHPQAHLHGNVVWYPDVTATPTGISTDYFNTGSGCSGGNTFLSDAVPAYTFTLPTFTPPFRLEPEACFTPPDPDPEQVINGCVSKNGTLKIVADPADCSDRETPISWLSQ